MDHHYSALCKVLECLNSNLCLQTICARCAEGNSLFFSEIQCKTVRNIRNDRVHTARTAMDVFKFSRLSLGDEVPFFSLYFFPFLRTWIICWTPFLHLRVSSNTVHDSKGFCLFDAFLKIPRATAILFKYMERRKDGQFAKKQKKEVENVQARAMSGGTVTSHSTFVMLGKIHFQCNSIAKKNQRLRFCIQQSWLLEASEVRKQDLDTSIMPWSEA